MDTILRSLRAELLENPIAAPTTLLDLKNLIHNIILLKYLASSIQFATQLKRQ